MEHILGTQPESSAAIPAIQRVLIALFLFLCITLITIYVIHRSEKARRLNIPGMPLVTGPWFGDFRHVLKEANAKVRIAMHFGLNWGTNRLPVHG